jgi:hypothetical protein
MTNWEQDVIERLKGLEVAGKLKLYALEEHCKDLEKRVQKVEFSEQYRKGIFAVLVILSGIAGSIFTSLLKYISF